MNDKPGLYRDGEYLGQPDTIPEGGGYCIVGRVHYYGKTRWMTDEEFAAHTKYMNGLRFRRPVFRRVLRLLWAVNLVIWSITCFSAGEALAWRDADQLIRSIAPTCNQQSKGRECGLKSGSRTDQ